MSDLSMTHNMTWYFIVGWQITAKCCRRVQKEATQSDCDGKEDDVDKNKAVMEHTG